MSSLSSTQIRAKQNSLISWLKQENPALYNFLHERKIDFYNLGKNAANLTSALALFTATAAQPKTGSIPDTPPPKPEVKIIEKAELRGKNDNQRASLVWSRYGSIINSAARKYNIDPHLIFATIMIESSGDTYAIRHEPRIKDASYGLGQILYGTARGLGFTGAPSELFDPEINIDLIARYHRRNLDKNPGLTPEQLTIAYNTGSPYKKPWPGHLVKFNKWYNRASSLEVDLS